MPYKDPEKRNARLRERYHADSSLKQKMYAWRRNNPEEWAEICRRSYEKRMADPIKKQHIYTIQREASKRWWKTHRDKLNEKKRRFHRRLKTIVLSHYSNGPPKCNRCGFSDIRALSIDHIDGGGRLHKKKVTGGLFYHWLKNNNYPEGFQVLCFNCQWIKRFEKGEFVGGANYLYHREAHP